MKFLYVNYLIPINTMNTYRFLFIALGLVGLTSWKVMPTTAPVSAIEEKPEFYTNPLILNEKPLNLHVFSIHSRGHLSVVSGDPMSDESVKIPFRIYLYRNGILIHKEASDTGRQVYDIAPVMEVARPGDDLVIDPVRPADKSARRVVRLEGVNWLFNWYSPGC